MTIKPKTVTNLRGYGLNAPRCPESQAETAPNVYLGRPAHRAGPETAGWSGESRARGRALE